MATCSSVCLVCDLQHQTSPSTHWCIECEEPLCSDCKQHHNVLKATRDHKTIHISDYQLLPIAVTDIKQHCVYHNEIYQLYCNKHENPICNKCVKDHGKCGEILSLEEIVREVKTSESFVDLEQSLDDLFDNIVKIRKDRESNIESIKDQKKKITAQACHLKQKVIQHVNKLEEEFIIELDRIEFDYCDSVRSIVSSLQDQAKKINEMKSDVQNTKKYASDLQAFLCMKDFQSKTTEFEKDLQNHIQDETHEKIIIESETETNIYDFLHVERLCYIKVQKIPSTKINLIRKKDRQSQIMIPKVITSINNVKLELIRKFCTTCIFSGCSVTKTGDFLFTNYQTDNEMVIAINGDSVVVYAIPFRDPYSVFDVVCLDDCTVAVSTGYSQKKSGISIVDLTTKKIIKFIDIPGRTYRITCDGKSLICCVKDKELHVISCSDYNITTIPNTALPRLSYVSTHADKIFFTNPKNHTVSCCLYSGALVWQFKDERVLDEPRGITIDNKGNIFVVGTNSCNVVVISPNGKQCKQILTMADGINVPTTIFFDKVETQLLVTNEMMFAKVFKISYV